MCKIASALLVAFCIAGLAGSASSLTLPMLQSNTGQCYDRAVRPQTSVVDSHVHFRPFGGPAIPFPEVVSYLERAGVLFANIYGIGQMLPVTSACTYYLDCPGTLVEPSLKNDFVNAASFVAEASEHVHLTLAMTFPDLSRPDSILQGMQLLDEEYPGLFTWMGEVNLVKQALFGNGRQAVPLAAIDGWSPFMQVLRERNIPLAIHSDLGNDDEPTKYLAWMQKVLSLYPDNSIVWMHLGLSRELVNLDAARHIQIMKSLLDRHPKLMLDMSWRVIDDHYFSDLEKRALYVAFLNAYSERVLPGTDFVASGDKDFEVYQEELTVTSRINRSLNDVAFRNIALGQNYFRLLKLDYTAPPVCGHE